MERHYETTGVWRRAFADLGDVPRQTLASQYGQAWDQACAIANRIQADAKGLTLHDERHFSALWEAVDLLVGDTIALNPVEVFMLGVAILIHDAAHTTLAFEGGFDTVSSTPEWADNLAILGDSGALPPKGDIDPEVKRMVLFETLRALHAKQAEKILSVPFRHPSLDANLFLLNDPTLRFHMGSLIGQIAASHHWDISKVARLPKSNAAVAPYHALGAVRPVLLAALMRTADAIQIDGHRASDFEFALTSPTGISFDHWNAQNRLAKSVDPDDREALLYNSTRNFTQFDAAAWWVAFDLATTADRELRSTNALLRDLDMPMLAVARVKDIEDPERFARHVRTDGWQPIRADIRIGNTNRIVELLGGRGLYGDNVIVPLRELIQNAIDAVRARRILDEGYRGTIRVDLRKGANSSGEDGYWLSIADDGVGMSTAVLVGPFLTFGESGWQSSSLKGERPGFIGKRFEHIGRYGIGFFSVFMYSQEIEVTSRQFDAAFASTKQLLFKSGLQLRPILQDAPTSSSRVVTEVKLFLSEATATQVLWAGDRSASFDAEKPATGRPDGRYTMSQLLGVICPAVDVELVGSDDLSGTSGSVPPTWQTELPQTWLERISGIYELPAIVRDNAAMMTLIGSPDKPIGRAALSPTPGEMGAYTVGGMTGKRTPGVVTAQHFFGTIDRPPSGPRRDPMQTQPTELAEWASEQAEAWSRIELSPAEQNHIAVSACAFGGDPGMLANARVDGNWCDLEAIIQLLEQDITLLAPLAPAMGHDHGWRIMPVVNVQAGFMYDEEDVVVELQHVVTSAYPTDSSEYWMLPNDLQPERNSFVGTLCRYANAKGLSLVLGGENLDFGYYSGPTFRKRLMISGSRIRLPCLKISRDV